MIQLSPQDVRLAMLAAQGLLADSDSQSITREDLLSSIARMGYLQIDTIQVVARSAYLVLWSRLGNYDPDWLDELHEKGALFEHSAHALCYIPIEQYPLYRRMMLDGKRVWSGWRRWARKHPDLLAKVLQEVRENGPVRSADFKTKRIDTGWGGAKQEKIALDYLFASGELMIPYRRKFQRYYDLRSRVLPDWDDEDAPDFETARKEMLLLSVRALGVAREDWVAPYLHFKKGGIAALLEALADEAALCAG